MTNAKKNKKKDIELIMFIADKRINDFMEKSDLKPTYKWFVVLQPVRYTTTSHILDKYLQGLIQASKRNKDFWCPAIVYKDKMYKDPGVKVLSDGKYELFLT